MGKVKTTQGEKKPTENLHAGHRQRMFEKLSRGGLCDHELLETLLFFAIPRRNTNDIAHRLLLKFGNLSRVFNATADELATVEGMGENSAAFLQCVGSIMYICRESITKDIPSHYQPDNFLAYAKNTYPQKKEEVFDVYFINDATYIFLHRSFQGDVNSVTITMKWLQKMLFECKPTGIVVIHNHPSGSAKPSQEDKVAAEQCQALCLNIGVLLCDFCVCAEEGVYSYYKSGDLSTIAKAIIAHNARKTPIAEVNSVE